MCEPQRQIHNQKNKDLDSDNESADVSALMPIHPKPATLQFVSVGHGGKVSNLRSVRSHVSKEYHQRKKEKKEAKLNTLTKQKRTKLQPSQSASVSAEGSPQDVDAVQEEEYVNKATRGEAKADYSAALSKGSHTPPPPVIRSQENYLIPYHWFEKDGPVLYVNRATWRFPEPLYVTGSDRRDLSDKGLTPRQSHWMPCSRTADFVSVRGAVLDPAVVIWIGQSPECFRFRVEIIMWIQEQLRDPVKAVSNATIGAIMTCVMWSTGYSEQTEIDKHMDAIESIIHLKGGFEYFKTNEGLDGMMTARLILFDTIIAVMTGAAPRFPEVEYFVYRPLTFCTIQKMHYFESPLFGTSAFEDIICYSKDQNTIIALLNKLKSLTETFFSQHTTFNPSTCLETSDPISFITESSLPHRTPLTTLPLPSSCFCSDSSSYSSHNHVLETILAAAVLYSRALTHKPPTDFPSVSNSKAFLDLYTAFGKCTHEDFWVRYEGVLLWVLLVGMASARGKKQAAFWMFYLSRTANFGSAESWLTRCWAVRRFLGVQRWLREGGD